MENPREKIIAMEWEMERKVLESTAQEDRASRREIGPCQTTGVANPEEKLHYSPFRTRRKKKGGALGGTTCPSER